MIEENGGGERTVGDNRARGGRKSGRNWGRGRGARGSSGIENGARPGTQPFTMNQRKPGSVPSDRVSPSLGRGQVPELGKPQSEASGDIEAEVCFICASPVQHTAVSPCNHRTCHICALRLRALYKTRACAHCRVRVLLGSNYRSLLTSIVLRQRRNTSFSLTTPRNVMKISQMQTLLE